MNKCSIRFDLLSENVLDYGLYGTSCPSSLCVVLLLAMLLIPTQLYSIPVNCIIRVQKTVSKNLNFYSELGMLVAYYVIARIIANSGGVILAAAGVAMRRARIVRQLQTVIVMGFRTRAGAQLMPGIGNPGPAEAECDDLLSQN